MGNIMPNVSPQDSGGVANVNPSVPNAGPKITALHPKVTDGLSQLITEAKARGLNVALNMGLRTAEQQDALYSQGRAAPGGIVTNAPAWLSWHNYGLAVDIVFKDDKGNWTWAESCDWDGLGAVGKMFGFQWGGDWTKFPDRPHFQMIGKISNVRTAKQILFEQGVDALWALV
jgi:peptidoglycan L-alanyl-D-glutamate endopeptidase CwlK